MRQPLFEHRRSFAGYDTRILELEGDGPPLVLFHGYADSADTWRLVLHRLGQAGRRALAVDLPGFATASPLAEDRPVLEQLDAFGAAVVRHAAGSGHEPTVVAGNSLGGCLAILLGQRRELPLAGIVPISPAGLDLARWVGIVERAPVLRGLLALPAPVPERAVREAVGRVYRLLAFADQASVEPRIVSAFTAHHRDRATVRGYLRVARRLVPELAGPFDLERIECPVLLLWGDRDRMVSHQGSRRLLDALPDTEYELLAGCGHCPQIERAPRVAELLLGFPNRERRAA